MAGDRVRRILLLAPGATAARSPRPPTHTPAGFWSRPRGRTGTRPASANKDPNQTRAWHAEIRLQRRDRHLTDHGKRSTVAIVALARARRSSCGPPMTEQPLARKAIAVGTGVKLGSC